MSPTAEQHQSLWLLAASPIVWAAHFLLCYITAAIWCEKVVGPGGALMTVRVTIAAYTAVALAVIGIIGWVGYRRHSYGSADLPHDDDTPEDRHRFLGFSTFLLSGLSAVATLYAALAAVFIGSCH
jgi:hypothetical protein